MSDAIPRSEYPRPQLVRKQWLSLNGPWQFEVDGGDSGLERGLVGTELKGRITVPFCPESVLSGIGNVDFMNAVWYRRTVRIPAEWAGKRVLLNFQAVDYDATVWANGKQIYRHRGGFTPFVVDLGAEAVAGQDVTIVVRARDNVRNLQPAGKQSQTYGNQGCVYTRTTGIWQSVWMEPVARAWLLRPRLTPDLANSCFHLEQPMRGDRKGLVFRAVLKDPRGVIGFAQCPADQDFSAHLVLPVPSERRRLWGPGQGNLYDVVLTLVDAEGNVVDEASSYAGLRSVTIDGRVVKINGQPVFQRLVLDQGYYPDGIMTAPSDEALKRDIELSLAAGFNGARLHQKVFEERFLYHADRMGYMVWGEFGDWGTAESGVHEGRHKHTAAIVSQWLEAVERDYSHPAVIGWCPLNETYEPLTDRFLPVDESTWAMFLATKAMDTTRPVLDTSGYSHRVREADIYDSHDYEQNVEKFRANQAGLAEDKPFVNGPKERPLSIPFGGQPYMVSEFGGIWWNPDVKPGEPSWGYGDRPKSAEEFYTRFEGLCHVLLDDPKMFGYCYTQLTDVFQEQNGVVRFDRSQKLDLDRLKKAQQHVAAVERP